MFYHGYDSYLQYAYPYDELKPLSCSGHDTWGSYSLTLIDALDTLLVTGSKPVEVLNFFQASLRNCINCIHCDDHFFIFKCVSVPLRGWILLCIRLKLKKTLTLLHFGCVFYTYIIAVVLSIAFNTPTGMPYGTVNLRYGVPPSETSITCTAGCGTFIIEFGTISALTGDKRFINAAFGALEGLWKSRSKLGLVGNHIDVLSGKWTAQDAGIGAGVDSYFEYLLKGGILFGLPKLVDMFKEFYGKVEQYLKISDWYVWAHMEKGQVTMPIFQSLDAYWPGLQTLWGDIGPASRTLQKYHSVWRHFGFIPEFYQIASGEPYSGRAGYPLRPELIESAMYLYRATKDPYFLEVGRDMLHSIESSARTPCGYATIKDVKTHEKEDRMESFFLAETTKYLYLLFDEHNFIHQRNESEHHQTTSSLSLSCTTGSAGYVFNTEAHPIDVGAVHCCPSSRLTHVPEELKFRHLFNVRTKEPLTENSDTDAKTFTGAYTCKARPFHKKLSVLGAFFEGSKEFSGDLEEQIIDP
ncbi:unnamed protein product [Porites evermanni]|uniref:alpha-1,2-Mannosidase n=1 Tax=Porites evermanni TaxID=104178 RepID=A0ABN8NA57_9CNID|nr:unnamed protein product [Porites evermanni]